MARQRNQQQIPRIVDLYPGALGRISDKHRIRLLPQQPGYEIPTNATFAQVLRYTDWYLRRGNSQPHYRYRRYQEVLGGLKPSGRRVAHVDIGCGAGLFSWVFLDWAKENNLAYDRIDLYGLDHSPAMIQLAQQMRVELMTHIADYPQLHYSNNINTMLQELTRHHQPATDYTVTFGHVLVQAPHGAIPGFARVIVHILELLDDQSSCAMLAVDARRAGIQFGQKWELLVNQLAGLGIQSKLETARRTIINNSNDAKIAWVSRAHSHGLPDGVDDLPF